VTVRELVTVLGFKLDDGPLKKYDKEIDSTKAKSNALAGAAKGIGTAYKWAAVAVGVGFAWISKNIVDATIEMEGYRSQMEAFTGDADSAAEALAALRDKTIDPLFGTGNLVNAYKGLRTIGMGAEDTSRMIDILGDVANGSAENFNALGNVLTRVATTGKVNEGTLRQLANAGFGVSDMAQGLGVSVDQLQKEIAAGKIGFQELTRAMAGAAAEGGRFYQNAERQARTLSGSIKILKDVIGSMGDAIGTAVLPQIVDTIRYVTNLIKLGRDGFVNFGVKAFEAVLKAIAEVIIFIQVL
jgi:tape measure domain-containing protein